MYDFKYYFTKHVHFDAGPQIIETRMVKCVWIILYIKLILKDPCIKLFIKHVTIVFYKKKNCSCIEVHTLNAYLIHINYVLV